VIRIHSRPDSGTSTPGRTSRRATRRPHAPDHAREPPEDRPGRRSPAAPVGFGGSLLLLSASAGHAYNAVKQCGDNERCRIVDVLDRGAITGNTYFSAGRVTEAWTDLTRNQGCDDVMDIVVGGTAGENGAPDKSVPAGFAEHLMSPDRCTIVVHYELEGPVIDALAYDDSVEHGRKALAITLNRIDMLRSQAGKSDYIRVWGHSKGASIVESTWRMEARNGRTKFITRLNNRNYYVNACPSNRCYYFGFGYPRGQEEASRFSISRATASTWTDSTDGWIAKPEKHHNHYWRLTTFTNLSDPIYECVGNGECAGAIVSDCHRYEAYLRSVDYGDLDFWNRWGFFDLPWENLRNQCGA
jgi:hypothetical protein